MATKVINANGSTAIGDSGSGNVTTKVIQFEMSGGFDGNITIQGRKRGSSLGFVALPYRRRYVNGAVGDEAFGSAVITANSLVEVNAAGVELNLLTAGRTTGSVAVETDDLNG